MTKAVLTISSKNYSSWSLRGWLLCKMAGLEFEEEVDVSRVTEFTFGKEGDQPLQVWIVDKATGGARCFFVTEIIEVR